jgi:hypothetical protein
MAAAPSNIINYSVVLIRDYINESTNVAEYPTEIERWSDRIKNAASALGGLDVYLKEDVTPAIRAAKEAIELNPNFTLPENMKKAEEEVKVEYVSTAAAPAETDTESKVTAAAAAADAASESVYDIIKTLKITPSKTKFTEEQLKNIEKYKTLLAVERIKYARALNLIETSLGNDKTMSKLFGNKVKAGNPYKLLKAIEFHYSDKSGDNSTDVRNEFNNAELKKEDRLDLFITKLKDKKNHLENMGDVVTNFQVLTVIKNAVSKAFKSEKHSEDNDLFTDFRTHMNTLDIKHGDDIRKVISGDNNSQAVSNRALENFESSLISKHKNLFKSIYAVNNNNATAATTESSLRYTAENNRGGRFNRQRGGRGNSRRPSRSRSRDYRNNNNSNENRSRSRSRGRNKITCFICKKSNHTRDECKFKDVKPCAICGKENHSAGTCRGCNNCGLTNHKEKECTKEKRQGIRKEIWPKVMHVLKKDAAHVITSNENNNNNNERKKCKEGCAIRHDHFYLLSEELIMHIMSSERNSSSNSDLQNGTALMDSCGSHCFIDNINWFRNGLRTVKPIHIDTANNPITCTQIGDICMRQKSTGVKFTLLDCRYTPGIGVNILSVAKFIDSECELILNKTNSRLLDSNGDIILKLLPLSISGKIFKVNDLEILEIEEEKTDSVFVGDQKDGMSNNQIKQEEDKVEPTIESDVNELIPPEVENDPNNPFSILMENTNNKQKYKNEFMNIHARMGHKSFNTLKQMIKSNMIDGVDYRILKYASPNDLLACESCIKAKMKRLNLKNKRKEKKKAEYIGQKLNSDIIGPINLAPNTYNKQIYQALGEPKYVSNIVERKIKIKDVKAVSVKSDTVPHLEEFIPRIQTKFNIKVDELTTDGAKEYIKSSLQDLLKANGTKHTITNPHTPSQNGLVEKHNDLLMDTARALLYYGDMDKSFWGKAVEYAAELELLKPVNDNSSNKTIYEVWYGEKPNLNKFCIFGCDAYVHISKVNRNDKVSPKSKQCTFIGIDKHMKGACQFYDYEEHKVISTRDFKPLNNSFKFGRDIQKIRSNYYINKKSQVNTDSSSNSTKANYELNWGDFFPELNIALTETENKEEKKEIIDENHDSAPVAASSNPIVLPVNATVNESKSNHVSWGQNQVFEIPAREPRSTRNPTPKYVAKHKSPKSNTQTEVQANPVNQVTFTLPDTSTVPTAVTTVAESEAATSAAASAAVPVLTPSRSTRFPSRIKRTVDRFRPDNPGNRIAEGFDADDYFKSDDHEVEYIEEYTYIKSEEEDYINDQAFAVIQGPSTIKEALNGPEGDKWKAACDAEIKSFMEKKVLNPEKLIAFPKGRKPITLKWVLVKKLNEKNEVIRYKARLTARGFTQQYMLDFDKTFAPVLRKESLRILLTFAVEKNYTIVQLDVVCAFLNAKLKHEIYITQIPGYEQPGIVGHKLDKSIYGLKQASHEWYEEISNFLINVLGFRKCMKDRCVFFKMSKSNQLMIISVVVDDTKVYFDSNDEEEYKEYERKLNEQYEITILGEVNWILGMKIERDRSNRILSINQTAYIDRVVEQFSLEDDAPANTPELANTADKLTTEHSPKNDKEREEMKSVPYMNAVGAILYAAITTRPDISHAVSEVSKYMQNPGMKHWEAVRRIINYLKRTKEKSLIIKAINNINEIKKGNINFYLHGYSDADWAGDQDTRKSKTGYVCKLNGNTVSWVSKLQKTVSKSSTEGELVSGAECIMEMLWIKQFIEEVFINNLGKDKCKLYCKLIVDNKSAIKIMENNSFRGRTKHIEVDYHFIIDSANQNNIDLHWIATEQQLADILTKPLGRNKFEPFAKALLGSEELLNSELLFGKH